MSIFSFREKDGTVNVRVSGYLTRDPKVYETVVLFSVCYANRPEKKYMDCKAWAKDMPGRVAACLERHDCVSVDGVYETYEGKDGQTREQIVVDAIHPVVAPQEAPAAPAAPRQAQAATAKPETGSGAFADLDDDDSGELPF